MNKDPHVSLENTESKNVVIDLFEKGFIWCFEQITDIYSQDSQAMKVLCDLSAPLDINCYLKLGTYYSNRNNFQAWKNLLIGLDSRSLICRGENNLFFRQKYDHIDSDSILGALWFACYSCRSSKLNRHFVLEMCWLFSKNDEALHFKVCDFFDWMSALYPLDTIETGEFLLTIGFKFTHADTRLKLKRQELKQVNELLLTPSNLLTVPLYPDLLKVVKFDSSQLLIKVHERFRPVSIQFE